MRQYFMDCKCVCRTRKAGCGLQSDEATAEGFLLGWRQQGFYRVWGDGVNEADGEDGEDGESEDGCGSAVN